MVAPLSRAQQQQVLARTEHFMCRAEAIHGRRFARIPVLFDLRGRAAGMFKAAGGQCWIRFNPWIFSKYFAENLRDTVPHEVAHYIVHAISRGRRVRPHGPQWQALMARFGAAAEVTFDRDLSGVPQRRQRRHPYRCACRVHQVSTTRHNRMLAGTGRYHCRYCDSLLVYTAP
ncbi:MAG: SprT-like domain-containing protein [Halioglobus sp.]|nr:SprT-like domain-containing protein [Halioglobus sp.]